jgi:hypothetical protein
VAALGSSARVKATTATENKIVKRTGTGTGTALSYRFVRDTKGWRVFVSLKAQPIEKVTRSQAGAMGMDLNADHQAMRKRIVFET